MLLTSCFAKNARAPGAVSIARFPPKWYTGARYLPLAPKPEMLKIQDWNEYRRRYREEILSVLDPDTGTGRRSSRCSTRIPCYGTLKAWVQATTSSCSALRKSGRTATAGSWRSGSMRPGESGCRNSGLMQRYN